MGFCKGKCWEEKNINAARYHNLNSKCTRCEIALNTDSMHCYCCRSRLRKRPSRAKTSMTSKLLMAQIRRY
ncbi:MAG: hypothetical protein R2685_08000 [Candidatus Nitrosocosmicus sp.]|nr:hypothetical protein [Candidatus Nitrosocosmicus sp.]